VVVVALGACPIEKYFTLRVMQHTLNFDELLGRCTSRDIGWAVPLNWNLIGKTCIVDISWLDIQ